MNKYKRWFSRLVWLGIAVNIYFSALTILVPDQILSLLGLQAAEPTVWVSFSGNLLILLSLFYVLGAVDPDRYRPAAWLAIFSRFAGVAFFAAMVQLGAQSELLRLALADLVFGASQWFLLHMGTRDERNAPRFAAGRKRKRKIVGAIAAVSILTLVTVGWFNLFRVVPQTFTPELCTDSA